jgi:hypothetical protein
MASAWYEAIMVGGRGCKLSGTYDSQREAQKAIKEANAKAVECGYKADEYFIVLCSIVRMIDDNGDMVSETITKARV